MASHRLATLSPALLAKPLADVPPTRLARVAGSYRWFPWGKDRRVGRLEGNLPSPGTARVLYRFLQEGQQQQARLTIVFNDRQARIRWDKPENPGPSTALPMPEVSLPRKACAELKPAPSP